MKKALLALIICLLMTASFAAGAYSVLIDARIDTDGDDVLIEYAGQVWVHTAGE